MVLAPLRRGVHTFRAYDEFTFGFKAGMTYTIVVRKAAMAHRIEPDTERRE
jgi:hypothetical protein